MANFNRPYFAKSTAELWRKWHISLSTWFFDYVYNPIAIAARDWDKWAVVYASLVTFFILGLWHGASWKFVIFGLLQGVVLSLEFLTRKQRKAISHKLPGVVNDLIGVIFTFAFFSFALIFFWAKSTSDAVYIAGHLFSGIPQFLTSVIHRKGPMGTGMEVFQPIFLGHRAVEFALSLFLILFLISVEIVQEKQGSIRLKLSQQPVWVRWGSYCLFISALLIFGYFDVSKQFIYFQF
jgi:hypothetical protein